MILKNLLRRKGRTILTVVGIAIGIAAIVGLGAIAQGLRAGFSAMAQGTQADLVLTQGDALSALLSRVDVAVADEMRTWPEVSAVEGVTLGNAVLGDVGYLFVFGYDPEGFAIEHFRIVAGQDLGADARAGGRRRDLRGRPILLGRNAAESLDVEVGDTLHFENSAFRIVGIYETGDGFEDGGAVLPLQEAQALALQPHHVSMLYVKLRDPAEAERLQARVARQYPELSLSTTSTFVDQEQVFAILDGLAMAVAGLAVLIGGVVMTNTILMSILERTREIGVLRALGWRRRQVLLLILGESVTLSALGGALGIGLGVGAVHALGSSSAWLRALGVHFTPDLFVRAMGTALALGLVGGAYPAWWASRLLPVEAMRYEGGSGDRAGRVPGGMAVRNLWRRRGRTGLTLLAIGISIAAVVALGALAEGALHLFTGVFRASQTDLLAVEADVDPDLSAIDERVGARIAARPDVEAVSGMIMHVANTQDVAMLIVFGYHPRSFAMRHFRIIEGEPLSGRHQVIVGKQAAEQMGTEVGDTLRLLKSNFRVAGIYETGLAYEEIGVVIGLREAQSLTGKAHQVMYYAIKLRDPTQAEVVRDALKTEHPGVDIGLTSEVVQGMSDFQVLQEMIGQISFLAVLIGCLGILNTMLMSVLERTREIGVLRALGWRRRQVLGMILRESLLLGIVGGVCGAILGVAIGPLFNLAPGIFGAFEPVYTAGLYLQAAGVALLAGGVGGIYPAWRATRMQPVEALRYE